MDLYSFSPESELSKIKAVYLRCTAMCQAYMLGAFSARHSHSFCSSDKEVKY